MGAIDEGAFKRLVGFIGGASLKPLMDVCVDDLSAALERMSRAVEEKDAAQVKRVAHMMAGVLAQYACTAPARAARSLAHGSDEEALNGAEPLLSECRAAISELRARAGSM
jgi:hypothetical protein